MTLTKSLTRLFLCWLVLARAGGSAPSFAQELVTPLPISSLKAWEPVSTIPDVLSVSEKQSQLVLRFNAKPANSARLLLKTPIALPADIADLTFLGLTDSSSSGMYLHVLLRDANNNEFLAYTTSPGSGRNGLFFPEKPSRRCRQVRFGVPGIARPVVEGLAGATLQPVVPNTSAKRPFSFLGFQLQGEHQNGPTLYTDLYLTDFNFSRLTPSNSDFYYSFNGRTYYGELDPLPWVTPGNYQHWGKRFTLHWEARKEYAGAPFLSGAQDFVLPPDSADQPLPLQFARKLEFPIKAEGTYWIRVKVKWYDTLKPVPDSVREVDYRLYIKKGEKSGAPPPVAPVDAALQSLVQIAPTRTSLKFGAGEKLILPVVFQRPPAETGEVKLRIIARTGVSKEELRVLEPPADWTAAGQVATSFDLSALPAGPYEVEAQVLAGTKIVDKTTRLVGKVAEVDKANAPSPAGATAWKEIVERKTPTFHLSPMPPEDNSPLWPAYKAFMDEMPAVSKELELIVRWKDVEPISGVYDWTFVDRVLDNAKSKGITVLLWPHMVGEEPEWLPSYFTENKAGYITGHTSYLFHGGRINYWHAPPIREAAMNFLRAMVLRYRSHQAVQGYFILTEQPGDASWAGWYDGYDAQTLAEFRSTVKRKYAALATLNLRWGTKYPGWDAVMPPESGSLPLHSWDWKQFKLASYHEFLLEGVKTIRALDSRRLIMVYNDGVDLTRLGDFSALGCILANGGSQDPERGAVKYLASALQGMQERTEDITPGRWGAGPTQIDSSLFGMTMGGGANTHCKAYMYTGKTFEFLRQRPYSLDRYEKFIPIWTELRDTIPLPVETFILNNSPGGTQDDPWTNMICFQSHLVAAAGNLELGRKGKLLLATGQNMETMPGKQLDGLVQYVQEGGTLVMRADAGRTCLEKPDVDWALLLRFGVTPPKSFRPEVKSTAIPTASEAIDTGTPGFTLRDIWTDGEQPGLKDLASFANRESQSAMAWKPFGKGKLVVVWAQTIVPQFEANPDGTPSFLRDLAQWAGVQLRTNATRPELWTNILQAKSSRNFYGLAYRSVWQENNPPASTGKVRYELPLGQYQVTEVISGQNMGALSAADIGAAGIALALEARAVALYRFTPTQASAN